MPELSIIIPCLNEAATLGFCLEKASSFIRENKIDGEIIVADNGSTDGSAGIARRFNSMVTEESKKGYGSTLITGIKSSKGKFIIMGDADDTYDFSGIMPFLELLREGNDLVVGNRFKGGIKKNAMPFLHRYIGNPLLSFAGRLFFKIRIGDFHCGLRGFSRQCYDELQLHTTGMEFASEMIVKASLLKKRIAETPVTLYKDRRNKPSHLRTWRDGWRHLRFLLLYSPRWLFLIPGIMLMIFGLICSVSLIMGPVTINGKRFDVHTLMFMSGFVLLGFQFISLYVFTRVYTATHGLIPHQQNFMKRFHRYFKLERGILLGIVLSITGLVLIIKSFLIWRNTGFGDLDPEVVLRWVIPSVTLLLLGVQLIISCFYLSILAIRIGNVEK
ncbi:MAG: glycosyltransferase family 2 protein [Chitinophagaceae bacterium]|jgi:glycosyltransferase involved in cell wall biosynthesis|nr:glycosyltransferase family 2 protein [Chitinophagaceae bacterium]OQY97028.1 MAG: dolichol-P-glucose synthetase [Sphingobacteriales bacterium UTBCD1]